MMVLVVEMIGMETREIEAGEVEMLSGGATTGVAFLVEAVAAAATTKMMTKKPGVIVVVVVELAGVPMAVVVCSELWVPESSRVHAVRGAEE